MTRDAKSGDSMSDDELIALLWRAHDLSLGNPYQGNPRSGPIQDRWLAELREVNAALSQIDDPRRAVLGERTASRSGRKAATHPTTREAS